jgi:serine/threonine-protein kinase
MSAFAPIEIGSIVANKYVIERILGEGGMGVVVAAHHTQLRQRVAIKFLLPAVVKHPESVARFVREARASVRIQSEHVARVLDVGELENGSPFMVMEYLEGTDLSSVLESNPPPSAETVIEYMLQACEAVAEAHSLGIVHRDLKPANLFVTRRADGSPLVKVLDFGISKSLTGADHALTKTATFVGSPLYASPEQLLSSRSVDARTDIWSLGIILYESCAGRPPFTGESVMEVASRVMKLDPQRLEWLRPDLPAGLCGVIMRCLEKDVAQRFATIGELARALGPYAPRAAVSVDRISRMAPALDSPKVSGTADTVSSIPPARSGQAPPLNPVSTQAEWNQRVSRGAGRSPSSRLGLVALALGAFVVIATSAGVVFVRLRHAADATILEAPLGSAPPEPSAPPLATRPPVPTPSIAASESSATPTASAAPSASAKLPPAPAIAPTTQAAPLPAATPRNPLEIKIK